MAPYNPDRTRKKILEAALTEFWRNGFRATCVDSILTRAGVTKGALYHHFKTKTDLGYAVVDELLRRRFEEEWIQPLQTAEAPIFSIQEVLKQFLSRAPSELIELGCPLNNLAQEMACVDEGFRVKIESVFADCRQALANVLLQGQRDGTIRQDTNARQAAAFIFSALEGGIGFAKNAKDPTVMQACLQGLLIFLEALRNPNQHASVKTKPATSSFNQAKETSS